VLLDHPPDEREPEPGSSVPVRVVRLEDPRANLLVHAGSVVLDLESHVAVARRQEPDVHRAAIGQDLQGVDEEVERDLVDELGIAERFRIRMAADADVLFARLGQSIPIEV
jgi:hypothetical protein